MITENKRVCVVGGGAAGMMAAGTAVMYGAEVTIFEGTDRLGKKLAITGKGRCNVTNKCTTQEFMENVTTNPRFLYTALAEFDTESTITFFESLGVELKTERGRRVFPVSDKAKDIVDAMRKYSKGANVIYKKVTEIRKNDDGTLSVFCANQSYDFDAVILATGGRSYPLTGSDGSGYRLAKKLGHTITELTPSLVPIESKSIICQDLQGLSLRNVKITVEDANGKKIFSDFGEMMFTHFGVTGPTILSASSHLKGYDVDTLTLSIDLKPALDEKTLDSRILSDFKKQANKDFINSLGELLPTKMIEPFVLSLDIDPRKKVNTITKEERKLIVEKLKSFRIPLYRFRPIEEAIITSGGVNVKEVKPKTMESKIIDGLYFAGEILDVDGYTGGYNLQIAFSTGHLAGKSSAEY